MKRLIFYAAALFFITNGLKAQSAYTFVNNAPVPITDTLTESIIQVSTPCFNDFVVTGIDVDIAYPQTGFLIIRVNGLVLSANNGGAEANYENTSFVTLGTPGATFVGAGTAPFNGTHMAELNFDELSGFPLNDVWTLSVSVPEGLAEGSINSWGITFGCLEGIVIGQETPAAARLSVYPNPASNRLFIRTPPQPCANPVLRLADATGRVWLEQPLEAGNVQWVDVGVLPGGVYAVSYADGCTRSTSTVTVVR